MRTGVYDTGLPAYQAQRDPELAASISRASKEQDLDILKPLKESKAALLYFDHAGKGHPCDLLLRINKPRALGSKAVGAYNGHFGTTRG
jgi:hypothetical protein